MSFLIATPDMVSAAAADLANLGSTLSQANTAAAAATTGVMPAALDEVSGAIATMFGAHGQAYQALSAQASQFHAEFVGALNAGANAYAGAEANVVQSMQSAVAAPAQAVSAAASSPLQQLEAAQLNFNSNLVNSELAFNKALVTNEVGLEKLIFGGNASALNGALNRTFNAGNLLVGTGEQTLNTVVGATTVPANFNSTLLLGSAAQVFNSGAIGGPLGTFDQSLVVGADLAGLALGSQPGQALLSLLPAQTQAMLLSAPGNFLQQLETSQIAYNTSLLNNETLFNSALKANESAFELKYFGPSAFNGALNRSFNTFNLLVGTGEQGLNNLSGALVTQPAFNQGLLFGSSAQVFNSGKIGGLVGSFDQSLMVGADLVGLVTGQ
jgi:hypothetical protein